MNKNNLKETEKTQITEMLEEEKELFELRIKALPFIEFQKTSKYKELFDESKEKYPHVDEITVIMLINLWYSTEILNEIVSEPLIESNESNESNKIINSKNENKTINVYTPEEHLKEFGDVYEQTKPIDIITESF